LITIRRPHVVAVGDPARVRRRPPPPTQSLQRFSIESTVGVDEFTGENAVGKLQIVTTCRRRCV
jgi:hypothetical protein